jgi:hypothetical protein
VSSLAVSGSDVYAAGYSNNSSQPTTPGYWLDGTWVGLTPLSGNNSKVLSIDVFGTDVYAGGYSQNSSDWYMPGYWFNGTWVGLEPLEGFASYSDSEVTAIAVSGGNVYAGGYCNDTSYVNHPGYWVNGIWVDLLPSGSIGGEVTSIAVSGTDVYAGGYVGFTRNISGTTSTIGVSYPCYWHNGTLIFLSYPQTPNQTNNGIASSIVVSGNNLYAGGNVEVESAPAGYVPGYWINGTWTPLTLPSGATEGFIFSIVVQ